MLTTPFFHLLKPENLELSLTPLFSQNPHAIHLEILFAPPSIYIQNLITSYRSLLHYCTQITIISLQDYCSSLPAGLPSMLSPL